MGTIVARTRRQLAGFGLWARISLILLLLVALTTIGGSAWAYWTSQGAGAGTASTGTLNPPTTVAANSTLGTSVVVVSWANSTTTAGGVTPTGYFVTRVRNSDNATANACGSTPTAATASTPCSDTSVPDGAYHYVVTAVKASWTASSSVSNNVTVISSVATTTTVASSANPSVSGQSLTYTATVTASSGSATPTGAVAFKDGATTITCAGGSQFLNGSGRATCQLTYASVGSHPITAVYSGAGSFTASSSSPALAQAVTAAGTTVTLASSANPSVSGQTVTYTATVAVAAPGTGTPTGTVTFKDGANPIICTGGAQTLSSGSATCALPYTIAGSHSITAVYNSDSNFNTSTSSPALAQVVTAVNQTISMTSSPPSSPAVGGSIYTVAATSTSGLTVTFTSGTISVCTVSSGSTVTFVGAGTCTINADQAGNGSYNAAPQVHQSFTVAKGSQTIAFTSNAVAPTVGGSTYTVTATGGASGNTVTFTSGTAPICTVTGSTVTFVGAGTCTIRADQAGNPSYNAATQQTQSFTVAKGSQTIAFTSNAVTPTVGGSTYTVTATGGASGNTVTFTSGTAPICTVTGSTVTFVGAGTCTIRADQAGNPNYNAATQQAQTFTVGPRLVIGSVVRDGGNVKVHFTGTGAAATTTVVVTICSVNVFPCATPVTTSTVTNPSAGSWISAQSLGQLSSSASYFAQAVQGTTVSATFSFSTTSL